MGNAYGIIYRRNGIVSVSQVSLVKLASNKNAQKIVVIMVIVSKGNAFVDLVGVEIVVLRSARRIVFEMY